MGHPVSWILGVDGRWDGTPRRQARPLLGHRLGRSAHLPWAGQFNARVRATPPGALALPVAITACNCSSGSRGCGSFCAAGQETPRGPGFRGGGPGRVGSISVWAASPVQVMATCLLRTEPHPRCRFLSCASPSIALSSRVRTKRGADPAAESQGLAIKRGASAPDLPHRLPPHHHQGSSLSRSGRPATMAAAADSGKMKPSATGNKASAADSGTCARHLPHLDLSSNILLVACFIPVSSRLFQRASRITAPTASGSIRSLS